MAIWTLVKKDLRLLLRDRRAAIILLAMPFIFMLILGISLGEGFGQKPDDRLRVSLVDLDHGQRPVVLREAATWMASNSSAGFLGELGVWAWADLNHRVRPPDEPWSQVVRRDLEQTADIR